MLRNFLESHPQAVEELEHIAEVAGKIADHGDAELAQATLATGLRLTEQQAVVTTVAQAFEAEIADQVEADILATKAGCEADGIEWTPQ